MKTRPQRVTASIFVTWLGLLALAASACGGSESHVASPGSAAPDVRVETRDESNTEQLASEPEPVTDTPCADKSCAACGSGLCLSGWYCDESAVGGPACGWLPECVQKSGCACLRGRLPANCECAERGGAPHVTCR